VLSYGKGLSVVLGRDGKVSAVSAFAAYRVDKAAPEMEPAADPPGVSGAVVDWPRYQLDGEEVDVLVQPASNYAVARMRQALAEVVIEGVKTNLPLQMRIMSDGGFHSGGMNIHYLEKRIAESRESRMA
jgi:hypothetical protein